MIRMKNLLAERMCQVGTKNINENESTTLTNPTFPGEDAKTYEFILDALANKLGMYADEIDDFTDQVDRERYLREFKKIIQSINHLANDIQEEMGYRAG